MNKVLVTGSEGYIGTVLMPMIIENGYNCYLGKKQTQSYFEDLIQHKKYQNLFQDVND